MIKASSKQFEAWLSSQLPRYDETILEAIKPCYDWLFVENTIENQLKNGYVNTLNKVRRIIEGEYFKSVKPDPDDLDFKNQWVPPWMKRFGHVWGNIKSSWAPSQDHKNIGSPCDKT